MNAIVILPLQCSKFFQAIIEKMIKIILKTKIKLLKKQ